jgi:hypothetical protein
MGVRLMTDRRKFLQLLASACAAVMCRRQAPEQAHAAAAGRIGTIRTASYVFLSPEGIWELYDDGTMVRVG